MMVDSVVQSSEAIVYCRIFKLLVAAAAAAATEWQTCLMIM
jgi:hypothetical protein